MDYHAITQGWVGDFTPNAAPKITIGNYDRYAITYGYIILIPYLSAMLDTLYYQDSINPNAVGVIKLIENNISSLFSFLLSSSEIS